jgi:signal peptidase II
MTPMRVSNVRRPARGLALAAIVLATIGCDRATKRLAQDALAGRAPQSFVAGVVRLEYLENCGGFLSLGAGLPTPIRTGVFTVGTAILLAGLGVVLLRRRRSFGSLLGLALLWAGGLSNLADRVARGSVVDFLSLGIGPVRTGVLNVADIAITVGALWVAATVGRGRTDSAD